MGTDIAKITAKMELVEQAAAEVRPIFAEAGDAPTMPQVLAIAAAMDKMRKALDEEVLKHIKNLENSALGFMTDKPDGGYPPNVIRDVMIEAAMHGMLPVNNEINIIAGRFYAAKNGLKRRLKAFPGLSDLNIEIGVPEVHEAGALVPMRARWKIDGVEQEINCWENSHRIPVRRNKMMGIDGLIGKAERKLYARILDRVAGMTFSEAEETIEAPIAPAAIPQTVDVTPQQTVQEEEYSFAGIGDERFENDIAEAQTLAEVCLLKTQYLYLSTCDEDTQYIVETCGRRLAEIREAKSARARSKE